MSTRRQQFLSITLRHSYGFGSPVRTNRIILPFLIAIPLAMVLPTLSAFCQDIRGGVSLIFQHHNPPVRRRQDSKRSAKQAVPNTLRSDQSTESSSKSLQDQVTNGAVEEALALGNSARDDKPPRFQDAERLYRLAAKLNPKDPRPHIGLGNVFYDQKRYAEAAEAYRKALATGPPKEIARVTSIDRRRPVESRSSESQDIKRQRELSAQSRAYLGDSLLQQGNLLEAGLEFGFATLEDPENAQWHALYGYTLFAQGKYSRAADALKRAVRIDPQNTAYQELLRQSLSQKEN